MPAHFAPSNLPRSGYTLRVALRCTAPVPLQAEFDCAPGELVALVGPSGSGKTTLLRAIAGLYNSPHLHGSVVLQRSSAHPPSAADDNSVWFDSTRPVNLAPQQRRVGLVFQQYALFPHLSAVDNIAICALDTWTSAQKLDQARSLLKRMGLADLAQRMPHQMSGGQQQRVALARALVRLLPPHSTAAAQPDPPAGVLLLDEPFSAVDAPMRQVLYRELAQLHASLQLPIVLVTHDLAEARRLADRVVIVDAGTTLQCGPPERVLRSPRNARVAQLVGIHNHFAGVFYRATVPHGWGSVSWGSLTLQAMDKGKIDDATAVTFVLAGDAVQVGNAESSPSGHAAPGDNTLHCEVLEMLPLGEISVCQLAVRGAPDGQAISLNLSTALLRSLGARVGGALGLQVPAHALHIMPVRGLGG